MNCLIIDNIGIPLENNINGTLMPKQDFQMQFVYPKESQKDDSNNNYLCVVNLFGVKIIADK